MGVGRGEGSTRAVTFHRRGLSCCVSTDDPSPALVAVVVMVMVMVVAVAVVIVVVVLVVEASSAA